jgi:hypothetical protein
MYRPKGWMGWRRRAGLVLCLCDEAYFLEHKGPRGF